MAEKILKTKTTRDSNFELLRLVCMFFILVLHVNNDGGLGIIGRSIPGTIFEGFCIVAVNCFVLISGYFSIKVSWRSFLRFFVFCFSYTFAFAVLHSIYNQEIQYKRILLSFFTFSHSPYWFVNVYFGLYVLSPALNKIIDNLSKRDFIICLLILTFVNIYLGFYSQNARFNIDGYNIMNFIYLYFIGRYIKLYNVKHCKFMGWVFPYCVYAISSLIIAITILICTKYGIKSSYVLGVNSLNYNNPLVIISSISLFIIFKNIKLQSNIINWMAESALAIFLIHVELPYGRFFQYLNRHYGNRWYIGIIYFFMVCFVFIVSIIIDKIRMLITDPIEKKLNEINIEKYFVKFIDIINSKM
jgi:hypothetical protein